MHIKFQTLYRKKVKHIGAVQAVLTELMAVSLDFQGERAYQCKLI